ncbi:WD40 repeat domain-containing protein [Oscillatoria salina]|uniref:WD40 repeat domain-containing protein n=1 Tax=Oscillatoria salina TaxID=331517 RepID=UPI0013B71FBD|nr:NB-ARC domain-containing protein [Oscillatoria salina]MBZ8181033.1 hypothetical protein [Oscillatoria salina IIICB1]NET90800.1 hypothetical protein [Kamptonema sp. SIO1D9]
MADSVRASIQGLKLVERAVKQKGWNKQAPILVQEAQTSVSTLKRFWRGKPIEREVFINICKAVGIDNWKDVVLTCKDWRGAIDVSNFVGRTQDISTLEQWILEDRCRLVAILGMGGIGKTALSIKLGKQIEDQFHYLIWLNLREAPSVTDILTELILFLSEYKETRLPNSVSDQITKLLEYLNSSRCLLILDNAESILQDGTYTGKYRQGCEGYGELFRQIGSVVHQSCLLLTSREKPSEIANLEGDSLPVRTLTLKGLQTEAKQIFEIQSLSISDEESCKLINSYKGNPQALNIVSARIRELYSSNVSEFFQQEQPVFGDIRQLLEQQFSRLSESEKQIMYWLAINRDLVSITELKDDLVLAVTKNNLTDIIESLKRRFLIEKSQNDSRYTLQNVVMEYVTEIFVKQVTQEITDRKYNLLNSHALIKAQSKNYIREAQIRLILEPTLKRLKEKFGIDINIIKYLINLVKQLSSELLPKSGYLAGNIINLLVHLQADLTGCDFSNLTIRQADLRNINLQDVNFTNSDLSQSIFSEIFENILSVALSADGRTLATGDTDGEIRLWEVATGQSLITLRGHTSWIRSLAFSPDDTKLASCSNDGTVRIWDVSNAFAAEWLHTLRGHHQWVWSVAFSPDGSKIASGSDDATIRLWDTFNGQCLQILEEHHFGVRFVTFRPDGQTLVSASSPDQVVKLWDIVTGQCLNSWQETTHIVRAVTLSPDGKLLVTGSDDSRVRLLDIETGEVISILSGHTNRIWSVAFSSNNLILASGSADRTIRLWNLEDLENENIECFNIFPEETGRIRSLAFSRDGKVLASGSDDQKVKLWNVLDGKCLHTLQGYTYRIWSVSFGCSESILATGTDDKVVRLWDISQGSCIKTFLGHQGRVRAVAISPNEKWIASGSNDQTIKIWDIATGRCLQTLYGHKDWVWFVAFNLDGTQLISASDDRTMRLWNLSIGDCVQTIENNHSWFWSIAFSSHQQIIASADEDCKIRLWNCQTGECFQTLAGHNDKVRSVAFNLDGTQLASGSDDQIIRIWDLDSGNCLHQLSGHTGQIRSVVFSPNTRIIASVSDDCTVKLWDVNNGQCLTTLAEHDQPVWSVNFSFDSRIVASGSEDATIKLWDVFSGERIKTLRPKKLYEGAIINRIKGQTQAGIENLLALGAKIDFDR